MVEIVQRDRSAIIADLNDKFRTTFIGGSVVMTAGVHALGPEFITSAMAAVRVFDAFTPDNDPYGEHDFGSLEVRGHKLFWKIDYYDPSMEYGSSDPCDAQQTQRVLTVMLAEEY